MINPKEAALALEEIEEIVQRVRQSRTYDIASRIMIMWGVLVFAGNLANYIWPRYGGVIWIAVNVTGAVGTFANSAFNHRQTGVLRFDFRIAAAYLLFFAFGIFCSSVLGHYTPRQMGTFWPVYFMLFYILAGLWIGRALAAIGLIITVLTLIGYLFVEGAPFLLWMAVVNGVGLVVGGVWMRRS